MLRHRKKPLTDFTPYGYSVRPGCDPRAAGAPETTGERRRWSELGHQRPANPLLCCCCNRLCLARRETSRASTRGHRAGERSVRARRGRSWRSRSKTGSSAWRTAGSPRPLAVLKATRNPASGAARTAPHERPVPLPQMKAQAQAPSTTSRGGLPVHRPRMPQLRWQVTLAWATVAPAPSREQATTPIPTPRTTTVTQQAVPWGP